MFKRKPNALPKNDLGEASPGSNREAEGGASGSRDTGHLRSLERAPQHEDAEHPDDPLPRSMIIIALLFLLVIVIGVCALTWAIFQQGGGSAHQTGHGAG
jgi:hypothetical protein